MALVSRELSTSLDIFDIFERWSDMFPWPILGWRDGAEGVLRVDEYREDGALVVRAEVAGIDPDKDVEVTCSGGILHVGVERHDREAENRRYLRHELVHRRRLTREIALPEGAQASELEASYHSGVLEIRLPLPDKEATRPVTKIPVRRS